jgi:EmrB/QacA subfamily drug resistance transporter
MARKWWTLTLVCVAAFMLLLDITVVTVAVPAIQSDLGASLSSLQWVIDAYALTLAAFLLVAGSIGDRVGRRRVFSVGFGIFTVASLLCGVAGDPTVLNLARGLQGIGASAMFATTLALIAQEFEGRERAAAIGAWGATVGSAIAIGPLVGGLLTDGLGWQWIFFINVPIGITAVVLAERKLVNVTATDRQPLDWAGAFTFSTGLFLLIFGLIRGNPEGWSSGVIIGAVAGAVVLLSAFIVIEARRGERAMLDLDLFRKRSFTGMSVAAWALSAGMFAMFPFTTLYIQNVLGYSPLEVGVRLLPLTVLSFLVAPAAARMVERVGVRSLMSVGLAAVGAGLLTQRGLSSESDWTHLLPGFLLIGFGMGLLNPAIAATAIGVVPAARAGMASGINNTFRQVGIATGVAGIGAVFQSQITSRLNDALPNAHPGFDELVAAGGARAAIHSSPRFQAQAGDAATDAFVAAFNDVLLIGAVVLFAGAVLTFALVRRSDFVDTPSDDSRDGKPSPSLPRPESARAGRNKRRPAASRREAAEAPRPSAAPPRPERSTASSSASASWP